MKKYEFLPHTADQKIRIYGKNLKEIIKNSLLAIKNFVSPEIKKRKINTAIKIEGSRDIQFLLIDFLNEVLVQMNVKKAIFTNFKVKNISENLIEGTLEGYRVSGFKKDIKAFTYHQAKLEKIDNFLVLEVIIDI